MADVSFWDTLRTAWTAGGLPAGASGTPITAGMTTQQKLDAVNSWTVAAPAVPAKLEPSAILNAIVPADLSALTQQQVAFLTMLLQGDTVDASLNTTVRLAVRTIFAGKTQTLQNLSDLVAPYDAPTVSWLSAHGYPRLTLEYLKPDQANLT